jgi:hypothetical protein
MKILTRLSVLFAIALMMTACGSKEDKEKKAAIAGTPVMLAGEMVTKYCGGDFTISKALTESCNAEKTKFGQNFHEGANCTELDKAMTKISELQRTKAGACRPTIRF